MAPPPEQASSVPAAGRFRGLPFRPARLPWALLALLVVIWLVLPLAPAETGLRFGLWFRVFFTAILAASVLFFWFLDLERAPSPKSTLGVMASVAGVYLATVGMLVAISMTLPQFGLPSPQGEVVGEGAAERGKALFLREDVGCFRCHAIAGTGGARGPDLTQVAARAGERVAGLSAEQYLVEKVKAGATYRFTVPEYVPIMPPFGQMLSEKQMTDLVAYLLTLE